MGIHSRTSPLLHSQVTHLERTGLVGKRYDTCFPPHKIRALHLKSGRAGSHRDTTGAVIADVRDSQLLKLLSNGYGAKPNAKVASSRRSDGVQCESTARGGARDVWLVEGHTI